MTGTGVVTISARYAAALKAGGRIGTANSCEVWAGSSLLATLPIEDSTTITVDRSNQVRRTCSVVLTDPFVGTPQSLVPTSPSSLLAPYGNELVLYRGINYGDGTSELVQVGVFGIESTVIADTSPDLVLTITGGDRSVAISHAGFTDVYTISPSSNIGTAIQTLITSRPTGIVYSYAFAPTTAITSTTPIVYGPGDDPWASAQALAASIGYELFFDSAGICTFLPVPDPTKALISWSYNEGSVNIATSLRRTLDRSTAANYIIRDGQGSGVADGSTEIAVGSNGASLPQSTINVLDTSTFLTVPGFLWVTTAAGLEAVSFTGMTATTFTGCTGGTGAMATGGAVTEQTPRGVAMDTNPKSPTYVGGPYGQQVDYQTSNLYTTFPQAQAAANADLLLALGTVESIEILAVPKPDHHPDDVVEVTRARSGLASQLYVIDSYQMGFGTAGILDFTCRRVTLP